MKISRRKFIGAAATVGIIPAMGLSPVHDAVSLPHISKISRDRYDPWIEVDEKALHHNVDVLSSLSGNKPIIAVVKNNAYGLGIKTTPKLLESNKKIIGFGVVKTEECFQMLEAGIKKPIMLLALPNNKKDEYELVRQGIELCVFTPDVIQRLEKSAKKLQKKIKVHAYIDTGMSRVGMPYHKALPWLKTLASSPSIEIVSTFTDLTEEPDYDKEQVNRLQDVANAVRNSGLSVGRLHAASSNGIYHSPHTHLDLVRPGISLFGAYPTFEDQEKQKGELKAAYRWRARVVRVTQLREGDSISYGRNYIAEKPTWIATLPVGHSDGYPRSAVKGVKVLIGGEVYPVVGAVSASHCIVVLGDEKKVEAGDIATLVGPDHPSIEPNVINKVAGISVYDLLMHMNPNMPKFIS